MTDNDQFSFNPTRPSHTAVLSEGGGGIGQSVIEVRGWEMVSIDFQGLTKENFSKMSREQAQEIFGRLNVVQSEIRVRMDLLRKRIWPELTG